MSYQQVTSGTDFILFVVASLPPQRLLWLSLCMRATVFKTRLPVLLAFLERSVPFEQLWRPLFLGLVGLCKVYLPHRDIQTDILPYTQPSFVGGGGLPFPFLYKEMSRCKRGFGDEGYKYVLGCRGCLWAALSSLNTSFAVR